jgi:hypothetical protein
MKSILYILTIASLLSTSTILYAESGTGTGSTNPLGIVTPFATEEPQQGYLKPEDAKKAEQKKQTWVERQISLLSISEKKNVFFEKSMANVYKRMKDQVEWNKNYTLQSYLDIEKKRNKAESTIMPYSRYFILQKDKSVQEFFNGRPVNIFNVREIDNYGNTHIANYLNLTYEDTDQFVAESAGTTSTHLLDYIKLDYDPLGAINYVHFFGGEYNSNILDRPSAYSITERAIEQTSDSLITDPNTSEEAEALREKLTGTVVPTIEQTEYATTTAYSNINYFSLAENTATNTSEGGVYGEKKSYDYTLTSTDAPSVTETGTADNIQYYLFDYPSERPIEPLSPYWWHAQDATLNNTNYGKEARVSNEQITSTRLGITKEMNFYDYTYDSHNSVTSYKQNTLINGTEVGRYYYSNINYDGYGRQISYNIEGNTYGLGYFDTYSGITYDTLSRTTGYTLSETIDGVTTTYVYWNMTYNNLWQVTDYFYSIDNVTHHRFDIKYNSLGLISGYTDISIQDGITTTIFRENIYNENGLLSEYTEQILKQGGDTHEFDYIWAGNISYNSIYAISSFDRITIRDTNATIITNYYDKIPSIINALIFEGATYSLAPIDLIAMGFNSTTTVTTEKWRNLGYYSVGESIGENYYNLTIDSFRGRLKSYSVVTRTTTTTEDTAEETEI